MWSTCLRHVGESGVSVDQLERLAGTGTNLAGLRRWGYVSVAGALITPTSWGRRARTVWRPLEAVVEARWRARFGSGAVDELERSLVAVAAELPTTLPDCLPILGPGLRTAPAVRGRDPAAGDREPTALHGLLSRVLLALAIDAESGRALGIAVAANSLRVLEADRVPVRDLTTLTGTSRAAVDMASGVLTRACLARIEPGRPRVASLSARGREAQRRWAQLLGGIGADHARLRAALEPLVVDPGGGRSPLFAGLEPYENGWRAAARAPRPCQHFPMVLHRGGYPDGS
jgi:hypothetical protein